MNRLLFLGYCIVLFFHFSQTAPVEPEDEVELISTSDYDDYEEKGFIPIFVVKQTSGSPFFGNFPFGSSGFPFNIFEDEQEQEPSRPAIPSFFENPTQEEDETLCGFICSILKEFETKLTTIEDDLKSIHSVTDQIEQEYDVNNTTYTEKVLPDGSIVKINRTVISDTSDDGTSYFFHSTSLHNVENPQEEDEQKPEFEVEQRPEFEVEQKPEFEEFPNATPDPVEYPDDSLNEVSEESRSRRNDPFAQQQMIFHRPNERRNDPFAQQQMIFHHPNEIVNYPSHWEPLHDDTRVNDIITQTGKRGSLIRIEPDSELVRRNSATGEIETSQNGWAQEIVS